MINGKTIGIDARMIEMSGIGTYIQHIMGQGIYDYAIGKEEVIRKYDNDVQVIPFEAGIYRLKEQLCYPAKEIKKAGIEIMHFPHYNVPLLYRGKYVVTVHDLTHIVYPEFLGNRAKYIYAGALMKHALYNAKHIFTVSENSKRDICRFFGTCPDMISITYNAIDQDFRVKGKEEISYLYDKYEIPKDNSKILYVGNLKPHKNLISLLKAIQLIDRDDVTLILAGKAFDSVDLIEQEKALGIERKVIHTGIVSKEELVDLYNLADLFVFPSLYEGFGIPPLEAMACGTPVIAADNSSIPEVLGDAARYFDALDYSKLAHEIAHLFEADELREALILKGFDRAKRYSWSDAVNEIHGVLSTCIQ